MNLFDDLKNLVTGGPAGTETPTQLATPASSEPVSAVAPIPAEPSVVSPVSAALPTVALDDDGEDPTRPVSEADEARIDLPQRSRQRIAFLLQTFEKDRLDRTQARIQNDRARYLMTKPAPKSTDRKPDRNPQSHIVADPTAAVPSTGNWQV